ncbi:MAG TPA: helix-turn-helix transcriptional regulator [Kofleriaceae bacterium]
MPDMFGGQLRAWRLSRRVSQEELAGRAGVSPRHVSFVENGKSQPSRDLVLALAGALDIPLRERNTLLTAAGYAAAYRASSLDSEELAHVRRAIDHILRQQEPYGAIVVDGHFEVMKMNDGAARLFRHFAPTSADGMAAARNIVLATFHPGALRPYIVNWLDVAAQLVSRLHREIAARPGDERLAQLLARVLAQPDVPTEWRVPAPGRAAPPILTVHMKSPSLDVRLFTMLTSIGTPLDVTAEEIHIESYFPADDQSDTALRG